MSVTIRDATPDDAASIAQIHVEGWRTTYRGLFPDAFLDGLDEAARAAYWRGNLPAAEGRHTLLAHDGDDAVGFVSGGPARDAHGFEAEVYAIYLLSKARRRGTGGRLMARMFRRFREDRRRSAHLWVHEGNVAGETFYAKLGGTPGAREAHAQPAPHTGVSYGWDEAGIARLAAMDPA